MKTQKLMLGKSAAQVNKEKELAIKQQQANAASAKAAKYKSGGTSTKTTAKDPSKDIQFYQQQVAKGAVSVGDGVLESGVKGKIIAISNRIISVVAIVAIGGIVFAGFHMVTAFGDDEKHKKGYSEAELDAWAARARAYAAGGAPDDLKLSGKDAARKPRDVYFYVISGHKELNPAAAMALIERLK